MKHISASRKMAQMIEQSSGKMVSVEFTKKDGTLRTLNGRLGVTKHLNGGTRTTDPSQYICIYDVKNKGYRSINKDTIKKISVDGLTVTAG